jgi:SAM-dependent methyltransferase
MSSSHYDDAFFEVWKEGAVASARSIVPLVMELVRPESVVDVGCGLGAWLNVFEEHGVRDIVGVDGDYVVRERLLIERDAFISRDLEQPLRLNRHFDLVVSLEVAEHLSAEAAPIFVESLVRLAPIVMFSAAIPEQGGAGHRNEQWPEYWAELFLRHDYEAIDCIRPRVWRDDTVEVWYAQNTLLYVAPGEFERRPKLLERRREESRLPLAVVHPRLYLAALDDAPNRITTRELVRVVPGALRRSIGWRLGPPERDAN